METPTKRPIMRKALYNREFALTAVLGVALIPQAS